MDSNQKIISAPSTYRLKVWQNFGFLQVDGVTDRTRTVFKICFTTATYKTGTMTNMTTHLLRKHGTRVKEYHMKYLFLVSE